MAQDNDGGGAGDGGYKVGYGKPPREHQFKKGKSGFPSGRKPRPADIDDYVDKHAKKKGSAKVGGKSVNLPNEEIIAMQLVEKAKRGDRHAFDRICELQRAKVKPTLSVTAADEAAVKAAVDRLAVEREAAKPAKPSVPWSGWSSERRHDPS